uniref:Biotin/lipoyl attachment domain-containing protein n=1 Tax=uncultured marine thaumarchaeote KM3_55_H11 TaxID=1456200 RepID=A0A075H911_9ARCH|nr:biotin/lipoyl attachment domain-containing protein [uncultured marine thaumarchaeote KM3_55_H11]
MEFKLEDIEETFNGEIINKISNNEYLIKIQDKEHHLQILNINSSGMEFVLDNHFHSVYYIENQTAEMKIIVDGIPLTINMHTKLDEIVYKNAGGADVGSAQINLRSQIPGKVVSIEVTVGDKVKKGDVVCVLESMKMQVSVKSHKDGEVKNLKIKEGNSINKNDILAEIE